MMAVAASLLCALVAAMCVYGLWTLTAGAGDRVLQKRARRLAPAGLENPPVTATSLRLRREHVGALDALAKRLLPRSKGLQSRLLASGMSVSVGNYALICLFVGAMTIVVILLMGLPLLAAMLAGGAAGLGLPHLVTGFLLKRRQTKFAKLFPEAIALMVRGLKASLPITDTILVVGREVADPVGEEFRTVADQVKMGQRLEDALWAVAKRLDMADFNFLVITLSVQRETGGNLAETLQNLEEILRKRQHMRLKVKAMSAEAIASASIIGCLPFVMTALLFVVSHNYIITLFTTSLGLVLTGIGGASLALGIFVMARMVRFEM